MTTTKNVWQLTKADIAIVDDVQYRLDSDKAKRLPGVSKVLVRTLVADGGKRKKFVRGCEVEVTA